MHRYSIGYRLSIVALVAVAAATTSLHAAAAELAPDATIGVSRVSRADLEDLGRAARSTRIDLTFALKYRNAGELDAFVAASSDPQSPEFGHYLTPAQFAAEFAPTRADYERFTGTLARAGFAITKTSPTRTFVGASAPAAVAESFFRTQFHAVAQRSVVGTRYAIAVPATIPAALRDATFGVAGLDDLVVAKTDNVRAASRRTDVALGPPLQGPDTGLSPYAFATAYDFPVQHARPGKSGATYDGTGHSAGIAIDSDFANSDIEAFLSYFKIKRSAPIVRVPVDGGSTINGDGLETVLDLETISGLSPGAGVYVYLMPSLATTNIVDTYAKVVEDDAVDVVNSSFGGCELNDNLAVLSDHIAVQGAAEGITFAASTGDFGAQTCFGLTSTGLGVSAPASAPHFTAVGGTSLLIDTKGTYKLEIAWDGSGGGVSTVFPLPSYQKGIANAIASGRNVPDVAFDANPGTGASLYYQGAFSGPIGGTSLASPLFTALVTQVNETLGKRSGSVNAATYAYFKQTRYGTRFRDVTLGNNSYFGPGYNALPGYDDVTGIGSIIGTAHAK